MKVVQFSLRALESPKADYFGDICINGPRNDKQTSTVKKRPHTGSMRIIAVFFLAAASIAAHAQSVNAPLNEDYYHWLDRYEVRSGKISPELFTTVKPYRRNAIVAYIDSLQADSLFLSRQDKYNYEYFRNDSWEWSQAATADSRKPFLRKLYRKKSDLTSVDIPAFDFHVNPVIYFGLSRNSRGSTYNYINTRGVELRGMVDRKVGFYAFVSENQLMLPVFVRERLGKDLVVPHEGFWKGFKSNGVDFFHARGYVDLSVSKHINMQLGHDRMFIGNGFRSLIWSDHAPPQLYLRANVKVWKLNYLYQVNRMVADVLGSSSGLTSAGKYPEKYVVFHHASFNVGKKLNLGLFESIVFSPQDSVNGHKSSFEWNYLNPIIFYRAVEQQFGSSDNAILGLDFKWNALKGFSVYGQFILDEFLLSHIRARDGWWANKYAGQLGIKYIDVFRVNNLDFQMEFNGARPFTYTHSSKYSNYSNFRQPIAHPLGANFREWVLLLRYQPLPKLNIVTKYISARHGADYRDAGASNYGGDILKTNRTRVQELGNKTTQGVETLTNILSLHASYMLKHNFFIEIGQSYRSETPDYQYRFEPQPNVDLIVRNRPLWSTSLSVRWNIGRLNYDF
jgi:hypothetical protein